MDIAETPKKTALRGVAIGVGDAGCNVIYRLAESHSDLPELVAVNTDERGFLRENTRVRPLSIGSAMTKGCGCGGNPQKAKRAAEMDIAALRTCLEGKKLAFFLAGMGGGTGSGATPLLLQEARKAGLHTMVFAILPFDAEDRKRKDQAERAANAIKDETDIMVCFPNQSLYELVGEKKPLAQAMSAANEMIAASVAAIWKAITDKGLLNLAFSDLKTFMEYARNGCVFATVSSKGPDRVHDAVTKLNAHPMLLHGEALRQTSAVLLSAIAGRDFSLQEMNQLTTEVTALCNSNAAVFRGIVSDETHDDELTVTVLACERKLPLADVKNAASGQTEEKKAAPPRPHIITPRPLDETARGKMKQQELFEDAPASAHGRFKNIAPTIYDGSNLDTPTFIRKNITIQKIRGTPQVERR